MLLNCGVGEDSWESLGLQEVQPVHPKGDHSWIFIGRGSRCRALCVGIVMSLLLSQSWLPALSPGGIHTLFPQPGRGEGICWWFTAEGGTLPDACQELGYQGFHRPVAVTMVTRQVGRSRRGVAPVASAQESPSLLQSGVSGQGGWETPPPIRICWTPPPISCPRRTAGSLRLPLCWWTGSLYQLSTHTP